MERIEITKTIKELFGKYKFVLLILCIGILFMQFPEKAQPEEPIARVTQEVPLTRAKELENILGQIDGVGKIKVLLTEADGAQTNYQTDNDLDTTHNGESQRSKTVIITNSGREEAGLIRSITPPVYLGAIVVCQGGDNPSVKLSIVQAVSNVTGISSDRITVLKMK